MHKILKYEGKLKLFRCGLRAVEMEETEATKAVEKSGSTRCLAISVWCNYELAQARWAVVKNYTTQSLLDLCIQVGTPRPKNFKKCTTE